MSQLQSALQNIASGLDSAGVQTYNAVIAVQQAASVLESTLLQVSTVFFNNSLTPTSDILAALGSSGGDFFSAYSMAVGLVNTILGTSYPVVPSTVEITITNGTAHSVAVSTGLGGLL